MLIHGMGFRLQSGEIERKLSFAGSVVGLGWHDKINQIIVGHGGRKEGGLSVLYNPSMSTKGAKLALATRVRRLPPSAEKESSCCFLRSVMGACFVTMLRICRYVAHVRGATAIGPSVACLLVILAPDSHAFAFCLSDSCGGMVPMYGLPSLLFDRLL